MRVLFAIHGPPDPRSAVYGYVQDRARFLGTLGHEVQIWTPQDFPALAGRGPRWFPLSYPRQLLGRLLREPWRPEVVIFHSFAGWLTLALRPFRRQLAGLTLVTQFHGLEPLYLEATAREAERSGTPFSLRFRLFQGPVMDALLRVACRASDHVLCLNQAERRFLLERGWAEPARITQLPLGLPAALYGDAPLPAAPRIAFLGQWLPAKGTRYLAEAFAQLVRQVPAAELLCLGTRQPAAAVRADFPAAVRDRIEVVPEAERTDLAQQLERCRVFVLPSLSEGWSLALAEAAARGRALVATQVGFAPDRLEDAVSALLVPPADAPALARALLRSLTEPGLAERCAAGARQAAEALRAEVVDVPYRQWFESLRARR
jgi:glycosyltransferase involved in cell wall biosynthesis